MLRLKPEFRMAYTNMAKAYNDLGQYQGALSSAERALRLTPGDAETLYYMGFAYLCQDPIGQANPCA